MKIFLLIISELENSSCIVTGDYITLQRIRDKRTKHPLYLSDFMKNSLFVLIPVLTSFGNAAIAIATSMRCDMVKLGALLPGSRIYLNWLNTSGKNQRAVHVTKVSENDLTKVLNAHPELFSEWPAKVKKGANKAKGKPAKEAATVTQTPNNVPAIDIQAIIQKGIEEGIKQAMQAMKPVKTANRKTQATADAIVNG